MHYVSVDSRVLDAIGHVSGGFRRLSLLIQRQSKLVIDVPPICDEAWANFAARNPSARLSVAIDYTQPAGEVKSSIFPQ